MSTTVATAAIPIQSPVSGDITERRVYDFYRRGYSKRQIGAILHISIFDVMYGLKFSRQRRSELRTVINGKKVVKTGLFKRDYSYCCELCNAPMSGRLVYHHWTDCLPHIGMWLCTSCHRLAEATDRGEDIVGLVNSYIRAKLTIIKECIDIDEERENRRSMRASAQPFRKTYDY